MKTIALKPLASRTVVRTTCPYCGVGCGIRVEHHPDGPRVSGDPLHPANRGRLCSKGSALAETIGTEDRLLYPEVDGRRVNWASAISTVADRFAQTIAAHGPDSVAFYLSGQLLTEDYYVANKLMKGFLGSANIDTNSRLCMASSVAGHRRAFGADVVPGSYEDLDQADLIVLVGSNLAWCHPVLYQRIEAALEADPSRRLVVIDPRRTRSTERATLHLPIQVDGDVALFNGLLLDLAAHDMLDRNYVEQYTVGLDAALREAARGEGQWPVAATGLTRSQLESFYQLFRAHKRVVTIYSQGVNQSTQGTNKVNAIINCHLATGRIGRPGTGPFSVTGQPNAMGGREVGGLANLLAAHLDLDSPTDRDLVARFWSASAMVQQPGLKAVDMFEAVANGRIKAIWIMSTNPVDSMPDADRVRRALQDCPFVVVSDIVRNADTVALADVLLPSTGWGEKDGTVTNSERCISRQRAFATAPGQARPDWWQMAAVGRQLGHTAAFDYPSVDVIFREHAALSGLENNGRRAFDISAMADLDANDYTALKPFYWPQPAGGRGEHRRFFAQGNFYTADRRARFVAVSAPSTTDRTTDPAFPLVLNTGRIRDHWHTMTRTGRSPRLNAHLAEPFAEMHPDDARAHGIEAADLVRVSNEHGAVLVRALLSERQQQGSIFVPMHWTDQTSGNARINGLITSRVDPVSGQPASKSMPVRMTRFDAAGFGFAVLRNRPPALDADYWAIARCTGGWRVEMAWSERIPPLDHLLTMLDLPGLAADGAAHYADRHRRINRYACQDEHHLLGALYLEATPVTVSRTWAAGLLAESALTAGALTQRALAARPGESQPDPGAIVCSCLSIGVNVITAEIRRGETSVNGLGARTGAGTNCGSCRAELQGLIDEHQTLANAA